MCQYNNNNNNNNDWPPDDQIIDSQNSVYIKHTSDTYNV
jgi:hypothetical protein